MVTQKTKRRIILLLFLFLLIQLPITLFIKFPSVEATVFVEDNFEDGDISGWSKGEGVDTIAINTTTVRLGSYGVAADIDGDAQDEKASIYQSVGSHLTYAHMSGYIRFEEALPTSAGKYFYLWKFYDEQEFTARDAMYIIWNGSHTVWKLSPANGTASEVPGYTVSLNTDYFIEFVVSYSDTGDGWLALYIDEVLAHNITNIENDYTARRFYFGQTGADYAGNGPAHHIYMDMLSISDEYVGPPSTIPLYKKVWYNTTRAGNPIEVESEWSCAENLVYGWLEHNNSGTYVNTTLIEMTGVENSSVSTFTLNSTVGINVQVRSWANSTSGNYNASGYFIIQTTATPTEPLLYTEGINFRENATDSIVFLQGFNDRDMSGNAPQGTHPIIGTVNIGMNVWNETNIRAHFDAMKVWKTNVYRVHLCVNYWQKNTSSYIPHIKWIADELLSRDIYMIMSLYNVNESGAQPELPYAPYNDASKGEDTMLSSVGDFVALWGYIASNMSSYPNVMYSMWNEPNGNGTVKTSWIGDEDIVGAAELAAIEVRKHSDQIIMIQWQYGLSAGDGVTKLDDWVPDLAFNSSYNFAIDTHIYRDGYMTNWHYDYTALIDNFTEAGLTSQTMPIIITETSPNLDAGNIPQETEWWENQLTLFKIYNISYVVWGWHHYGSYRHFNYDQATDAGKTKWGWIPEVYDTDLILAAQMRSQPSVWTVGNEILNGYNYLYSNNTDWDESWNGTHLNVTIPDGSGAFTARVFWNISSSYPINSTLRIALSNGSSYDALDYYDADKCLIIFNYTTASDVWMLYGYGAGEEGGAGWTGIIIGVTNPSKIMGIEVADISKVNGIS